VVKEIDGFYTLGGSLSDAFVWLLSDVCLTSVCRVHRE